MWEGRRRRRRWPLTPAPLAQYLGFFPCSGADPGDLLVTSSSCHPFLPSSFATAPGLSCSVPCWVPKNAISLSLLLNSPLWQRCLQRQHLSKTSCGVGLSLPQSRGCLSPGRRGARGGSQAAGLGSQEAQPIMPCESPLFTGKQLFLVIQSVFQAMPLPWLCLHIP